jgi:thiamine biosynthesis lipoprotein
MKPCWPPHQVTERAQAWLGTLVSIRVDGLPRLEAHAAINAAFKEIKLVHQLMSFHQPGSDVSRLNREASSRPVKVHPYTLEVLEQAMALSTATNGCFDTSVGAELVRWGWLPNPLNDVELPNGTWRDIEINADRTVRFRRPVWIDLGGIAKGYAVDRAAGSLREKGVVRAVVNAGGDIRVLGQQSERIALGLDIPSEFLPIVELADGSIASSSGHHQRLTAKCLFGPHFDGVDRSPTPANRFVCVLAERCMIADALTKVVMADGPDSAPLLRQFGASAYLLDAGTGWQSVNSGMDGA